MDRLTEKCNGRNVIRCERVSCASRDICAATTCCVVEQTALDKLAAYEATGLEPEEIRAMLAGRDTVRHGQWGMRNDKPYRHELLRCSACGQHSTLHKKKAYCQKYGALMDETEDTE